MIQGPKTIIFYTWPDSILKRYENQGLKTIGFYACPDNIT